MGAGLNYIRTLMQILNAEILVLIFELSKINPKISNNIRLRSLVYHCLGACVTNRKLCVCGLQFCKTRLG